MNKLALSSRKLRLLLGAFLLSLALCSSGCNLSPRTSALYALPVNMAAAWFGNVAIHEGGHAFAAHTLGARSISLSILPGEYEKNFHFGFTTATFPYEINKDQERYFLSTGTAATFLSHVTFGEINRSGIVSPYLQPTLQWMDFGGMLSTYAQSAFGLARIKSTDLGAQDVWIAGGFLSVQVIYDLVRIGLSPGGFEKYFNVLLGNDFY